MAKRFGASLLREPVSHLHGYDQLRTLSPAQASARCLESLARCHAAISDFCDRCFMRISVGDFVLKLSGKTVSKAEKIL